MAGDMVKARIVIDATGAIKEVERLSSEIQGAVKPSSQYAKEVAKIGKELRDAEKAALNSSLSAKAQADAQKKIVNLSNKYEVATNNLTNSLEKEYQVLTIQGATVKDLASEIKKLQKIQAGLYNSGDIKEAERLNTVIAQRKKTYEELAKEQKKLDIASKGSAISQYGKKVAELLKNIMGFQLIIAIVRKGLTAISNTMRDSVRYAAELEQITNKLTTVFDGFGNSATKAAQSLSSQLGVAMSTASSTLSTIGDLLQAQGMGTAESLETATRWAKQFQDIIAFKDINMDLNEFAQNFMSGAAGNLRNFRTFGSIVKESAVNAELAKKGLDKLTGSQLELAKMTTRAEMALRQQANSIGATEREWETILSVNRRLSEAQKELKENIGDYINDALKPLKQWWTDILQETNKNIKAVKEYNAGAKEIKVFDVSNNIKDMEAFGKKLAKYSFYEGYVGNIDSKDSKALDYINEQIVIYGATVEQAISILGDSLKDSAKEWLYTQERVRKTAVEAELALEKRIAKSDSMLGNYENFIEAIRSIGGVKNNTGLDIVSANGQGSDRSLGYFKGVIGTQTITAIAQATKDIMKASASDFDKALDESIGNFGLEELLQAKIDAQAELYAVAWNQFLDEASEDGTAFSEKETKELENLIKNYQDLNGQLEKYKALEAARSSLTSGYTDYQAEFKKRGLTNGMTSRGMSSEEATIRANWITEINSVVELFKTLDGELLEINGEYISQKDYLASVNEHYKNLISEMETEALNNVNSSNDWYSAFTGEFTGIIDAIKGSGDWVTAIISIAASMETFEDLFGYADKRLSQLDAFLRPLKPMLQTIIAGLDLVVVPVLKALFPIIKLIASVITVTQGAINAIKAWLTGSWGSKNDEAARAWDEAMSKNKEIWAMQLELESINQNTEDMSDEFAYYSKLLEKGVINTSEFDSLTNGFTMQRAGTTSIGSYVTGTKGITYNTGETVINISGAEMTREELIEVVAQAFARRQQAGYV